MGRNVAQKLIAAHLREGSLEPGAEIGLAIDHQLCLAKVTQRMPAGFARGIERQRHAGRQRRLRRVGHAANVIHGAAFAKCSHLAPRDETCLHSRSQRAALP